MILIFIYICYRVNLLLSAWKVRDSKAATPGKPCFYPWRSPPYWFFRAVMGVALWCVTLAVTLIQLVNLNVVKRVRLFVYHGILAKAETVGFWVFV